jgi:hypothetical protein
MFRKTRYAVVTSASRFCNQRTLCVDFGISSGRVIVGGRRCKGRFLRLHVVELAKQGFAEDDVEEFVLESMSDIQELV